LPVPAPVVRCEAVTPVTGKESRIRRGAKPTKAKVKAKLPVVRKPPEKESTRVRDLEKRLAEALEREAGAVKREAETQEQQTATAEILRVISASPIDVSPVFRAIVRSATRLCDATFGTVFRFDGELITVAANQDLSPEEIAITNTLYPAPATRGIASGRAIVDRAVVHISDIRNDPDYVARAPVNALGFRTALAVPMLKEGSPIGVFVMWRREVRPFTDKQIELARIFADQAVIAIENVRLFKELEARTREATEALEYRTATSDVLNVISRSPTDVQPVFDMIAESAARLCEAQYCFVYRFEGQLLHFVAHHGLTAEVLEINRRAYPAPPSRRSVAARAVLESRVVQIPDVNADPDYALGRMAAAGGYRSAAAVPILRDGVPIGSIAVTRAPTGLLPDRQIELLQTFADQAVIAIENVRLFTELQQKNRALTESLDQQTATSEILRVISSSPTDAQPVFDTIAASALRLCDARLCTVFRFDGKLIHLVALDQVSMEGAAAYRDAYPAPPGRGGGTHRAILTGSIVHIPDIRDDPEYELHDLARANDFGCVLSVPMLRDRHPIGAITVGREAARPFADEQIELLKTFADQALIAIENVQLFYELQEKNRALTQAHAQVTESLEQQTATAEILRVISSSPTDITPVLNAVSENAARLCEASDAQIFRVEGDLLQLAASFGSIPIHAGRAISRGWVTGRSVVDRRTIQVHDLAAESEEEFPVGRERQRLFGHRTTLATPLLREGQPLGAILIRRMEVRPFSDKQIKLLETFADQAVIAIENVRLFRELQEKNSALTTAHAQVSEALDQQTATSEILRVISSSPTDVQPVFDAIAAAATTLCAAQDAGIFLFDGTLIHFAAHHNQAPKDLEALRQAFPRPPGRGSITARAILTRGVAHTADLSEDPDYDVGVLVDSGFRAVLSVPMLRDSQPIGAITVTRREPVPFADKQIALLQTFADQAVIAIENVRLFTELQEKNRALTEAHAKVTEALEQQTATAEILRVISSSPTDVQPIFDAIVRSAVRLCSGFFGIVTRYDGHLSLAAEHNMPPEAMEVWRQAIAGPLDPDSATGQAVLSRAVVHRHDAVAHDVARARRSVALVAAYRTLISVPMLLKGEPIGTINVARREVQPFSEAEIALLQTFADQAVIAIENVRLFTELQTSNRELTTALDTQTATSDILRVISQSQTDVQPVFDTIIRSAVRLLGGFSGVVTRLVGDQLHLAALTSTNSSGDAAQRALWPRPVKEDLSVHGQVIAALAPRFVTDVESDPSVPPTEVTVARARGYQSIVGVPLLRNGRAVGSLTVTRQTAGPFADGEIALLKTFADQAVIAIENVRLFKELEARTQDLTRSVGELQALSEVGQAISSTLDLQTVLHTIVARATQLSDADAGVIYEYDEPREVFVPRATEHLEADIVETMLATPVRKGEGATGRLAEIPEPIQVPDILAAPAESRVRGALVRAGYRALLAVPLIRDDHLLGGLTVIRKATGAFAPEVIELLTTFATQSALAIQNARLFREIEEKSRQLEAASQHKSEFLANMSHELRTPLNAIIGFSEVLSEKMFGELNEKQEEYSNDIHASGQHLLSLINDILDLSKIEAGRMELELSDFHLPTALDSALTLVRERVGRRALTLHTTIDRQLGDIQADERKIRQVVLNLLSNAIKFTPEGGRIEVQAMPRDGSVEVSVSDTGVGIAPEDQEKVFEEFRQVGTADKKAEGTGLGLTLCRKFIELHGGRIWVKSQLGAGSTFTFTIPVCHGE
jgi:two-component system, NtrC family, sensor kinase